MSILAGRFLNNLSESEEESDLLMAVTHSFVKPHTSQWLVQCHFPYLFLCHLYFLLLASDCRPTTEIKRILCRKLMYGNVSAS